ncbi:Histidine phosphatase superfamily, clade-1 [Sesbania bispinosa]|nr:Histidine phosphatase superfamily, clade-1 [Sesbania bispinosa]
MDHTEFWYFGIFDALIGDGVTKYMQSHFFDKKLKEGLVVFPKPWKESRWQLDGPHGWQQWLERLSRDGCHDVRILLRSWIKYRELQGLNKQEIAERYGKEKVHEWQRSYDIPPSKGESFEMCSERAVAYFKDSVRVGSPVGPTEAGIYAYTQSQCFARAGAWGYLGNMK